MAGSIDPAAALGALEDSLDAASRLVRRMNHAWLVTCDLEEILLEAHVRLGLMAYALEIEWPERGHEGGGMGSPGGRDFVASASHIEEERPLGDRAKAGAAGAVGAVDEPPASAAPAASVFPFPIVEDPDLEPDTIEIFYTDSGGVPRCLAARLGGFSVEVPPGVVSRETASDRQRLGDLRAWAVEQRDEAARVLRVEQMGPWSQAVTAARRDAFAEMAGRLGEALAAERPRQDTGRCTCGDGSAEEDRGAVLRCPVHGPGLRPGLDIPEGGFKVAAIRGPKCPECDAEMRLDRMNAVVVWCCDASHPLVWCEAGPPPLPGEGCHEDLGSGPCDEPATGTAFDREHGTFYPACDAHRWEPTDLPAWSCLDCGQRNSGWCSECGRCGRARDDLSPAVAPRPVADQTDAAIAARERTRRRLEGE